MFAVIPHPTEAHILTRIQKASLFRLNAEAGKPCWIPAFPLWAFFNNFDRFAAEIDTTEKEQRQCEANADKAQNAPGAGSLQTEACDAVRLIGGNADTAFGAEQLKTLRDAIASFTIGVPEIANGEFFFPVTLRFKNGATAFGKITAGTILTDTTHGGPTAGNTASGAVNIPPERRSIRGGADFSSSDRFTDSDKNSTDANSDTSPLLDAEHEENTVGRFPYACRVFRIADAEIVCTLATDSNDARKKTGRISAGDTNGVQLRTWRVYKSIWVKTEDKTV